MNKNIVMTSFSLLLSIFILSLIGYVIDIVYPVNESVDKIQNILTEHDINKLMAKADAARGANAFKKCSFCHDVNKIRSSKIGPNLYDIVGKKKAHDNKYNYSPAMRKAVGIWDYASLFKFIYNPKDYIKGNKMYFTGIMDEMEIADIIAYLNSEDNLIDN